MRFVIALLSTISFLSINAYAADNNTTLSLNNETPLMQSDAKAKGEAFLAANKTKPGERDTDPLIPRATDSAPPPLLTPQRQAAQEQAEQERIRTKRKLAVETLARLRLTTHQNNLPRYQALKNELLELHNDLREKTATANTEKLCEHIKALTDAAILLLSTLSDPQKVDTEDKAKKAICDFKNTAANLDSFEEPTWKTTGRWVLRILIVAACILLGAAAGTFIFGFAASAFAAPTAGFGAIIAGIPAALGGIVVGGTIGMNCGLVATTAFGLVGGFGLSFFATRNLTKTRIDHVINASEDIAAQFQSTKPNN